MKKLACLALLALSWNAIAGDLGDYAPATNICGKFSTFRPSTGAAFTLAGTPALSVYKDNSTTQSTTGVTLTADFDAVTGLNHYCIDTSADGTFYAAGSNFDVVITTGTVDSVSVVGSVVGSFTLNKTAALRPTTAGRTFDVASTGEGGVDLDNVLFSGNGPLPAFGIIDRGTAQAADANGITLRAGFSTNAANMVGVSAWVYSSTNGLHARCVATAYNNTSKVLTCSGLGEAPTGTVLYAIFATPSSVFAADSIDSNALANSAATEVATALQTQALNTGTAGSVGERLSRIPNAAAGGNGGLPTVNASNHVAGVVNLEQIALADAAVINCTVNTAFFAGSTTTVACILTDRDGGAITAASNDLEGRELLVLSGAQIYEGRYITDSTWDGANSELRLTLSRALPGTLADAVTAIIR